MANSGYYSYPILHQDSLAFISENDIWMTTLNSLIARRITCNRGIIRTPVFSPDGEYIAFSSTMEGQADLFTISTINGQIKRLTYFGDDLDVLYWRGEKIYFASSHNQPFKKMNVVWHISEKGGSPEKLNIGPANFISFEPNGKGIVMQRHGYKDFGYWKRYRGGTAGEIWITQDGENFEKLLKLHSNFARPLWMNNNRIAFSSDHEGIGILYSSNLKGEDLKNISTNTNAQQYYVRNQSSYQQQLVYQAGADIWLANLEKNTNEKLNIEYCSDRTGRARKVYNTEKFLQDYDLSPNGSQLAIISRGKLATFANWDGNVKQLGLNDNVRYRAPTWLHCGERLLVIRNNCDQNNLAIFDSINSTLLSESPNLNIGRINAIVSNPCKDSAILFNHRCEVIHINLNNWETKIIDKSLYSNPSQGGWSRDGNWFTYGSSIKRKQMAIKLLCEKNLTVHQVSEPILIDESPTFDYEGNFIYFVSHRTFEPSYDAIQFERGFNYAAKIYAIALRKDTLSPFLKNPNDENYNDDNDDDDKENSDGGTNNSEHDNKSNNSEQQSSIKEIEIDLDNISQRIFEFPLPTKEYYRLLSTKGKLYFIGVEQTLSDDSEENNIHTQLEYFDFSTLKNEQVTSNIHDIQLSAKSSHILARSDKQLRVIKVGGKFENEREYNKKYGWIDLNRVRLMVNPVHEWQQMYWEAWQLQKDHYWVEDMSQIDWKNVFDRYYVLLERISNREEFSDLIWEMQGELGTSHSYVMGGDNKKQPAWSVGSLGADFYWNEEKAGYSIYNIAHGDKWCPKSSSSIINSGINIVDGDILISVNGQKMSSTVTPNELLFNQANSIIELDILSLEKQKIKKVLTKITTNLYKARYRDWVTNNQKYIDKKTDGKVGYIHIPDMCDWGFAEFHRYFLQEMDKEGLIIDVRYNGGGNVSQLLLEKLARVRIGYDRTRWFGTHPYPDESPMGPMIALSNEYTGSDGDIFSHAFKVMKLGQVIGKRTWGGVIGILPRYPLVDGGMTTQPEFSFWSSQAGWSIENYGAEPDQKIEITPQDYSKCIDRQIDVGIDELLKILPQNKQDLPDMKNRPDLSFKNKK